MIQPKHIGRSIHQPRRSNKFIPEQAPEPRARELARRHGPEAQGLLHGHHVSDGFAFHCRQARGVKGQVCVGAELGANVEEVLWPEEGAHVLCAEGGCGGGHRVLCGLLVNRFRDVVGQESVIHWDFGLL